MNRFVSLIATTLLLAACAFGRSYDYSATAVSLSGIDKAATIALAVHDARPYVMSGNKSPSFVGLMRGGFGNPFDVKTQSGSPLATELANALSKSFGQSGAQVTVVETSPTDSTGTIKRKLVDAKRGRAVLLTLTEWKSDTMMRTSIIFDATVVVLDASGKELAHNSVRGQENIGSTGLDPGASAVLALARKLDALFEEDSVSAALKAG